MGLGGILLGAALAVIGGIVGEFARGRIETARLTRKVLRSIHAKVVYIAAILDIACSKEKENPEEFVMSLSQLRDMPSSLRQAVDAADDVLPEEVISCVFPLIWPLTYVAGQVDALTVNAPAKREDLAEASFRALSREKLGVALRGRVESLLAEVRDCCRVVTKAYQDSATFWGD